MRFFGRKMEKIMILGCREGIEDNIESLGKEKVQKRHKKTSEKIGGL